MVAIFLAVLLGRQILKTDVNVRYENAGSSAARVLGDLSKLANVHLEAAPETAGEILVVRLENNSLSEAMKHIAWAVDGEWKTIAGGFRLTRPPARQAAEEAHELQEQVARLKAAIAKYTAESPVDSVFDFDAAEPIADALAKEMKGAVDYVSRTWQDKAIQMPGTPAYRGMRRIVATLDPVELARLPETSRTVFAVSPNRFQRPLGQETIAAIRQYLREQMVLVKAMKGRGYEGLPNQPGARTSNLDERSIGRILLTVGKYEHASPSPDVDLLISDRTGQIVCVEYAGLSNWSEERKVTRRRRPSKPIQASDLPHHAKLDASGRSEPFPSSELDLLLHPEAFDPVSRAGGVELIAVAKEEGLPLVVDTTDNISLAAYEKQIDPNTYLDRYESYTFDREANDDWEVMRPHNQAEERAKRVDRQALGAYIRRYADPNPLTIDELVALSSPLKLGPIGYVEGIQTSYSLPFVLREYVSPSRTQETPTDEFVRFYSALTPSDRKAAQNGTLRIGDLTESARERLEEITYGGAGLEFNIKGANGKYRNETSYSAPQIGIASEPTESFPNGLPPGGILHLQTSDADFIDGPQQLGGMAYYTNYGPAEIAECAVTQRQPLIEPRPNEPTFPPIVDGRVTSSYKDWKFVTATHYKFTVQFTPVISYSEEFTLAGVNNGPGVPYEQLPETFRRSVLDAVERFKKEPP